MGKNLLVDFLFDSGAKVSLVSVSDEEIMDCAKGSLVHGVGGKQRVGKESSRWTVFPINVSPTA